MKIARLALTTLLGVAFFVSAAPTRDEGPPDEKKPWQWTAPERAEARRDPAKRLQRIGEYAQKQRQSRITPNSLSLVADVIDGNTHPELYFPTELFEILVRSSFVTLPVAYPRMVQQRSSDLFKDDADWKQFTAIVATYAEVLRNEKTLANAIDRSGVSAVQPKKCMEEALALRNCRRTFGKARFDRMLYETVPRDMRTSFSIDTDFEKTIGKALEREERCQ